MSRFLENSESNTLRLELSHASRCVHHALDNYGKDMESDLAEELQQLEKEINAVLQRLSK